MMNRLHSRLKSSLKYCVVITALALTGCATVPDAIKGTGPSLVTDFSAAQKAPQAYKGMEARFGGRVLNVLNQPDTTQLEIAVMPLNSSGAPFLGSASVGRMYARINGFHEPSNFRDQYVTVIGTLNGTKQGHIGGVAYTFPVIDAATAGGPVQATTTLIYKVYREGSAGLDLSSSAAQSVILMMLVIGLTFIQFRFVERKVRYQ